MNVLEQVRENAGYYKDNHARCGNETMVIIESIAICFQGLIDLLESKDNQYFNIELYKDVKK